MLKVVDAATVETHGGKIFTHEGKQLASPVVVGEKRNRTMGKPRINKIGGARHPK
jgi:hypothetical protein